MELTVGPKQAAEFSAHPIPKGVIGGRHDIWTFLSSPQMKRQDFAILEAAGTGKTTLGAVISSLLYSRFMMRIRWI